MSRSRPELPRILMVLDFNSTIGEPRTKRRFLNSIGIDGKRFADDWKAYWASIPVDQQPAEGMRSHEINYLLKWTAENYPDKKITFDAIKKFAQAEPMYQGVLRTLSVLKEEMKERGFDLHFAVITNAWQDIIANTSLVTTGLIDPEFIFGQKLMFDHGGDLVGPDGSVSKEAKPGVMEGARRRLKVLKRNVITFGNGYSDEEMFRANWRRGRGGRNIGVYEHPEQRDDPIQKLHAEEDFAQLSALLEEGLLSKLVHAQWTEQELHDAIWQVLEEIASRSSAIGGEMDLEISTEMAS